LIKRPYDGKDALRFNIYREMLLPHGSAWLMVSAALPPSALSEELF
jgi:hypothetical protein